MSTSVTKALEDTRVKRERERLVKKSIRLTISHILLSIGALVMIFPLLWLISSSFKLDNEIFSKNFSLIPRNFTLENFSKGWYANPQYSFMHFFLNTITLVSGVIIGNMISCSMTAFGIARLKLPGHKLVLSIVLMTLMLPGQVTLIPQYLMFSNLGWLSTFRPFIIPAFMSTQSFFVYMLVQFMRGIPGELDESAKIDGASPFRIYFSIILPLCKASLCSVAIFSFIWTWNDFLGQLIYLNEVRTYTVSLILNSLVDATSKSSWGSLMALTLISISPCCLLYFSLQKYFVEGIATSGLKG